MGIYIESATDYDATGLGDKDESEFTDRIGSVVGGGAFTAAIWARADDFGASYRVMFEIAHDSGGATIVTRVRQVSGNDSVEFTYAADSGSQSTVLSALGESEMSAWHLCVMAIEHDGTDADYDFRVYEKDGTLLNSVADTNTGIGDPYTANGGFTIGCYVQWNADQYQGDLAEFALWNRKLSDNELTNLYKGYVQVAGWPSFYVPLYHKADTLDEQIEIGSGVGASTNTRITNWSHSTPRGGNDSIFTSASHPPVPPPFPTRAYSFPTAILPKQGFILKWGA